MTPGMERLGDLITLTADRRAGQAARRTVRERAAKVIGDAEVLDDIELMAAEGIANAVLHGSGLIRITVSSDGRQVLVEVRDEGPVGLDADVRRRVDHGRGLAVIDALSAEWGLEQSTKATHLWFLVEIPTG
ncbi:ATP-binding protein [Spirillospora sp. NPDC050679]